MARGRPWRARVDRGSKGGWRTPFCGGLNSLSARPALHRGSTRSTQHMHAARAAHARAARSTHTAHARRSTTRARDCKRLIRDERTRLRASARVEFVLGTAAYNECVWRCSSTTEPRRRHHLRRCGSLVAAPDRATLPHDPYCTRLMEDARAPPLLHFCQGGLLSRTDDALRKVQRAAPRQSRPSHGLGETGGG